MRESLIASSYNIVVARKMSYHTLYFMYKAYIKVANINIRHDQSDPTGSMRISSYILCIDNMLLRSAPQDARTINWVVSLIWIAGMSCCCGSVLPLGRGTDSIVKG